MKLPASTQETQRARNIGFRLLKIRHRSEKEIKDRIKLKGINDETIEQTLQYFRDAQFIDDRQFARWWISSRLTKPFGFKRIQFELRNKGISDEILRDELAEMSGRVSEIQLVESLVQKRLARFKNVDPTTKKRRLFEFLAR